MNEGIIFNIQRYSIHDGPGIRTTVFLKGCPLRCSWCQNPESQSFKPEVFLYEDKCTRCGECVKVCPVGATSLSEQVSTINRGLCLGYGKCVEVCPNEARRLIGRKTTVGEVMSEVLKDKRFYENSGGGITLSGGEPTAQPSFALALLQSCKEEGLHTTIETCGYASWSTIEDLLKYTDFVLYDIKHMDPEKHFQGTGKDNELILENAKRIAKCKLMKVRVPLIPDFNDSIEDIRAIAHFIRTELGPIDSELLHYNKMAEVKYRYLDRDYISREGKDDGQIQALEHLITGQ